MGMRKLTLAVLLILTIAIALPANTVHRTVYVSDTGELGTQVTEAIKLQEVPLDVVSSPDRADIEVSIESKYSSQVARNLMTSKLGRSADHVMKAVDRKSGRTLLTYEFTMRNGDDALKRIAISFVSKLQKTL